MSATTTPSLYETLRDAGLAVKDAVVFLRQGGITPDHATYGKLLASLEREQSLLEGHAKAAKGGTPHIPPSSPPASKPALAAEPTPAAAFAGTIQAALAAGTLAALRDAVKVCGITCDTKSGAKMRAALQAVAGLNATPAAQPITAYAPTATPPAPPAPKATAQTPAPPAVDAKPAPQGTGKAKAQSAPTTHADFPGLTGLALQRAVKKALGDTAKGGKLADLLARYDAAKAAGKPSPAGKPAADSPAPKAPAAQLLYVKEAKGNFVLATDDEILTAADRILAGTKAAA
jgi:hypothetical protein